MNKPRKFPETKPRVETGPIQFGDDWPGVFIRGDNALYFGTVIDGMLRGEVLLSNPIGRSVLEGIRDTLKSCDSTASSFQPNTNPTRVGFHKIDRR